MTYRAKCAGKKPKKPHRSRRLEVAMCRCLERNADQFAQTCFPLSYDRNPLIKRMPLDWPSRGNID